MAWRIDSLGDYGTANALGLVASPRERDRRLGLAAASAARAGRAMIVAQLGDRWLPRALLLAAFAFFVFGPVANLVLWSVGGGLVLAEPPAGAWGFRFWETRIPPRARRWKACGCPSGSRA